MSMKRHKLLTYILAACACLTSACREEMADEPGKSGMVTIRLNSKTMDNGGQPRQAGIDALNENKVEKVHVFFFENAASGSLHAEMNVPVVENQFQVMLPDEMEGNSCYVGIIANTDDTPDDTEGKTWNELKQMVVTTEFKTENNAEERFVMQGLSTSALTLTSGTVAGPITLRRVAAKISLTPVLPESLEIDGVTYTPDITKAHVRLRNAVKKASIDGSTYAPQLEDFMNVNRYYTRGGDMTGQDNSYSHLPLYTYPNNWSTDEEQESYLELCIPWTYTRNGTQMSSDYYYNVTIGKDKLIKSNAFYNIKVNIGVLGSLDPNQTIPVEGEFVIQDWTTAQIDADMNRYEYLMLETNNVELNNEDKVTISLATSSVAEARVVSVTYPDYSTANSTIKNESVSGYEVEVYGQSLTFEHVISPEAFTPRTITIEVTNQDGEKEELIIVQNPPIYIVAENNRTDGSRNRFVYKKSGIRGTVWDDARNSLGTLTRYDGGSNSNPNQYTIYITSLDADDNYVIGDPREENYTWLNNISGLQYYYPTKQNNVERLVAPAYKIASSWGQTQAISYESAQKRCATYQENGYPAGRWRVPTEGEIEYIAQLSDDRQIPILFGGNYWASSKKVYQTNGGFITRRSAYVRCVYDVWYWGDGKIDDPYTFTWGDESRN